MSIALEKLKLFAEMYALKDFFQHDRCRFVLHCGLERALFRAPQAPHDPLLHGIGRAKPLFKHTFLQAFSGFHRVVRAQSVGAGKKR